MPVDIIKVFDPDDLRINEFSSLRLSQVPNGLYLVEGKEALRQAVRSKDIVVKVFLSEEHLGIIDDLGFNSDTSIECYTASKSLMSQLVGFHLHQGVLATVKIPAQAKLGDSILALNGIANVENVGAILRTAVSFGIRSIVYDHCSPYVRRSVRVSMGAVSHAHIHHIENLVEFLHVRRQKNYEVISIERAEGATHYSRYDYKQEKVIFIVGAEGEGIDPRVLEMSDSVLEVPMEQMKSINVNAATAVVLADWYQRATK